MAGGAEVLPQGPVLRSALLILCTFGTHPQPFDRALGWVLAVAGDGELVVQHGATAPRPDVPNVRWHQFLDYDELTALMREAQATVCHAGVGTLMTAIGVGVVPVAIPRLRGEGEHVDDHQIQIAGELGKTGYVIPCGDRNSLRPALERAQTAVPPSRPSGRQLLRAAVLAAGGNPDPVTQ